MITIYNLLWQFVQWKGCTYVQCPMCMRTYIICYVFYHFLPTFFRHLLLQLFVNLHTPVYLWYAIKWYNSYMKYFKFVKSSNMGISLIVMLCTCNIQILACRGVSFTVSMLCPMFDAVSILCPVHLLCPCCPSPNLQVLFK